ncbi:unnamed protein product, partial [Didymodactylos carnosus]
MISGRLYWIIWLSFIVYSVIFAPNSLPSKPTLPLIEKLLKGEWYGINAYVISLFYLMGIWPLIYSCILFVDGQTQSIHGGLISLLSMALGGFVLLPYFAIRYPHPQFKGPLTNMIRFFESKLVSFTLTLLTIGLFIYALFYGNFQNFVYEFFTQRFINIMSIDFCIISLLFPILIRDDLSR